MPELIASKQMSLLQIENKSAHSISRQQPPSINIRKPGYLSLKQRLTIKSIIKQISCYCLKRKISKSYIPHSYHQKQSFLRSHRTQLQYFCLYLDDNRICRIIDLSLFFNLQELDLSIVFFYLGDNRISETQNLQGLTKLTQLNLCINPLIQQITKS